MIALPHGGSVTVQFNPCLVIEHPIIRCVLCVDTVWVGLWKHVAALKQDRDAPGGLLTWNHDSEHTCDHGTTLTDVGSTRGHIDVLRIMTAH